MPKGASQQVAALCTICRRPLPSFRSPQMRVHRGICFEMYKRQTNAATRRKQRVSEPGLYMRGDKSHYQPNLLVTSVTHRATGVEVFDELDIRRVEDLRFNRDEECDVMEAQG